MNLSQSLAKFLVLVCLLFGSSSLLAQNVQINNVSAQSTTNTSCTNTFVDVVVDLFCINAAHNGNTFTVNGFTIDIDVSYTLGPICLPALATSTFGVNLGMLPPGTYTVNAHAILNGTSVSTASLNNLMITSCCSASPAFTSSSSSDTICVGDSLNFTSTGAGLTSQKWFENNLFVSSTTTYGKRFNTPGTYDIKLVATDASCTDSLTRTIFVSALPPADLGADTSICQGDNLLLFADTINDSVVWFDGSTQDSIFIFTSGVYYLTAYRNGCVNSDTLNVGLLSPPSVDLGPDTILCVGDSLVLDVFLLGATYLWQDQSTASSLVARDSGSYSVLVTDSNGCSSSSIIHIAIDTTCFVSTHENHLNGKVSLYPNPVRDVLVLDIDHQVNKSLELAIYDASGKIILNERHGPLLDHDIQVNSDDWNKGLYFIKITVDDQIWSNTFVKE